ncbi:MAG TPA: MOSC N-terminal beta barrel domain-containing protein [Miltoncostaeaceae bacterium]|nr:MOSC N-terminal beta barrel domain-containing protein [Miltoncostaeaceae bacterium]
MGIVSDLWRFPVKSFGGERVRRAFLGPFGILGDRRHAVIDGEGNPLTARRAHALLGFRASCEDAESGEGVTVTTPEGWDLPWDDPGLADEVGRALGHPVRLARSAVGVHDAAPVHLLTSASLTAAQEWVAGEEIDRRRFRANVILELDEPEPFAEAGWIGRALALGDGGAVIEVVSPTERCAITTFDPDTLERDNRVLAGLARSRENLFGVYARVARPGWVWVGGAARLAPAPATLT